MIRSFMSLIVMGVLVAGGILRAAEDVETIVLSGTILDRDGKPAVRATVVGQIFNDARETLTDTDGKFDLRVPSRWLNGYLRVKVSHDGGKQQGNRFLPTREEWAKALPVRLQLQDARRLKIHVVDGKGAPVADAYVGAIGEYQRLALVRTDAKGQAICYIDREIRLENVFAFKPGTGLDYRSYQLPRRRKAGTPKSDVKPPSPDDPVSLTLDGVAPIEVIVESNDRKPIAEVALHISSVHKPSEPTAMQLWGLNDLLQRKTDSKGVARFDWIPAWERKPISISAHLDTHVPRTSYYDPSNHKGRIRLELERRVRIAGRVTLPDGQPAVGIAIVVIGDGYVGPGYSQQLRTDANGQWEAMVYPNLLYLIAVRDLRWAAPAQDGLVIRPDSPRTDLDFRVRPATRIHGRVTAGKDNRPVVGQRMQLFQRGKRLGDLSGVELPNPENSNKAVIPALWSHTVTDKEGRYEFHTGPGSFVVIGPNQAEEKRVEIKDETSLVCDFHAARAETGTLLGLVVTGDPPQPVAKATVMGIYRHQRDLRDLEATTDANGRFTVERSLHRTVLFARSADKRLSGVVEITEDAETVTIQTKPPGSAFGRLLDSKGSPLFDHEIIYGVKVPLGDDNAPFRTSFGGTVKTDKQGRFNLTDLVVGQKYEINVTIEEGRRWQTVASIRANDATPVDLGNLVLRPSRMPTLEERIADEFESKLSDRQRFSAAVRDARLSFQHVLLILADPANAETRSMYELKFKDIEVRRHLDPYRVVAIPRSAATDLAKHLRIELPKTGTPLLLIYDVEEVRLASSEVKSREELLTWLKSHAPKTLDAKQLLADALARAKKENKRVLIQETATWCGPCWVLSRFLDRHRELWSKDYIWVKIDHRWHHAREVVDGIKSGYRGGIPWTAILDADGKLLITSNDAEGNNIGFASGKSGIDHFISMFRKTCIRLTDEDLARLRKALEAR